MSEKRPNVSLAMGYGEEKCENCKGECEVLIEPPGQKVRRVCKPCVVYAVLDLLSKR